MINVCCVFYGNKNDVNKVEDLYNKVQKNLNFPFKFYCFTNELNLFNNINNKILFKQLPRKDFLGWWNILQLFNSKICLSGVNIFLDLNIKITKNLNNFVTYENDNFFIINENFNTNIIKWNNKTASFIWEEYINKYFSILHIKFNDEIASIIYEEYKKKQKNNVYYFNVEQVLKDIMKNNHLLKFFPKELLL